MFYDESDIPSEYESIPMIDDVEDDRVNPYFHGDDDDA